MKKSRKIIYTCLLILPMIILLAGCSKKSTGDSSEESAEAITLEYIAEKLCDNADVPPYEVVTLGADNFEYFAFIPYAEEYSAVAADALVNITPHSLVLIYTSKGNGEELAGQIITKADPNKWLCVGSETVRVAYTDHYVVLIMSYADTAGAIVENFKKMVDKLDGMSAEVLSADNDRYEQLF